jgi:hypothetical protein
MCSSEARGEVVDQLTGALDSLAAADVVALDDATLRGELLDLLTVANRVHAELTRRVDVFDRRGLADPDGFKTAKSWLQAFGRVSGQVAHRLVKTARLLRHLPKLGMAAQSGDVSAEHLRQVSRLADQVGVEQVTQVDATLADAAAQLDAPRFGIVCDRVRAHVDPDGPDPAKDLDKRTLSLTPTGAMVAVRGLLDPEGGAALATALDAVMTPPGEGDTRTAGQRRADALVELARRLLTTGTLPSVGGVRPQVGVLLQPQALSPATLEALATAQQDTQAAARLREFITTPNPAPAPDWTRNQAATSSDATDPVPARFGRTGADMRRDLTTPTYETEDQATPQPPAPEAAAADRRPAWSQTGWADPPWLNWVGPIPPELAQRIACDADIWRVILDPATGMPLDVGRTHRLVPHWIRKTLYARDRGCRWTGCTTPAEWTDGHHLDPWADHGQTKVERLLLLCRHHHLLVHEGRWRIDLDPHTGEVHITRPEGIPYHIPHTRSTSWNGPTTQTG